MKVTCDREKLLSAFQLASGVAPSRSPKPILSNVKLVVEGDQAVVMATDLEIGVRVNVPGVQAEVSGAAILPIQPFGQVLRESTDAVLQLEGDERGTVVRGERSEFRLQGADPQEFPDVAEFAETKYHELSARLLRELIRRTVFATDNESSRYALGGVLLEMGNENIVAVGTDGRRLATMEAPAKSVGGHNTGDATTIVPTRAMQVIERFLADSGSDAEIQIAARGNDVLIRGPRATVHSRLVEGRFPKWRDVFPRREGAAAISLVVGPLYSCFRQAAIATSDESRGVDCLFENGKLVLTGRAADVGQSRVELPIPYEGEPIGITLDPRFMNDFLRVLDADKSLVYEVKDAESAAVCHTEDGCRYVIMPLARDR